jgi:hypothetical protein
MLTGLEMTPKISKVIKSGSDHMLGILKLLMILFIVVSIIIFIIRFCLYLNFSRSCCIQFIIIKLDVFVKFKVMITTLKVLSYDMTFNNYT